LCQNIRIRDRGIGGWKSEERYNEGHGKKPDFGFAIIFPLILAI
jgi:hypothetical protein